MYEENNEGYYWNEYESILETFDNDDIVGGSYASHGEYPSIVFIYANGYMCGGTILSEYWVLTAAHCGDHGASVRVTAGEHRLDADDGFEQNRWVIVCCAVFFLFSFFCFCFFFLFFVFRFFFCTFLFSKIFCDFLLLNSQKKKRKSQSYTIHTHTHTHTHKQKKNKQKGRLFPHPDYRSGEHAYDIAVVQLDTALKFNTHFKPVSLSDQYDANVGYYDKLVAVGWGVTSESGTVSMTLKEVTLEFQTDAYCKYRC